MYLGNNIRYLRKSRSLSQGSLAELLGYRSFTTIQKWEDGTNKPSITVLKKMCDLFGVDLDALTGSDLSRKDKKKTAQAIRIPVLGRVAAGPPIDAIEDVTCYEDIPAEWLQSGEYFALQIKGSSMAPRMVEGDVVIMRRQSTAENGDIAIVMVGNNEATCKKIKITESGILLQPLNPEYEPMFYTNEEIVSLPVSILGKVTELRAKF